MGEQAIAREVRIRLPRTVICELKRMVDLEDTTMNAIVAHYIDKGLKADGRAGVFELAQWFEDYLRRKGGRNSSAVNTEDRSEDFT